jgi:uncharacterized protein (TIGR00369 family)
MINLDAAMSVFVPSDQYYKQKVAESFEHQQYLATIGARLTLVEPGLVEIQTPFDNRFTQQDGFLHAGAVTALIDTACGYAAYTLMPVGSRVLAVEFKVNFLRPAAGEIFLARGRVIKAGRTLTVCSGQVYAGPDDAAQQVVAMQATMIRVPENDN